MCAAASVAFGAQLNGQVGRFHNSVVQGPRVGRSALPPQPSRAHPGWVARCSGGVIFPAVRHSQQDELKTADLSSGMLLGRVVPLAMQRAVGSSPFGWRLKQQGRDLPASAVEGEGLCGYTRPTRWVIPVLQPS